TLNSATLSFLAMSVANASTAETVGALTLASGQSTVQTGYGQPPNPGTASTLTFASLGRNAGATGNFVGANATLGTTANKLLFTTAARTTGNGGGILPYGEVNGGSGTGDFATYGSNGVAAYTSYVVANSNATFAAAGVNDIVKVTAALTVAANQAVGALLVVGS